MAFDFLKFNSLRSRLLLLVALAIAPSLLMTVYNGWKERQNAIATAEENLQRLTNLAAINEANSIENTRQLLADLSEIPDLRGAPQQCSALLEKILKKNPDYANLGLIQLNGDVTCSAIASLNPVNLGDRSHFKRAVAERKFIAGNYVFGRVIQKHTINLTYPVTDAAGSVVAVVFAALDLAELDRFINGIDLPPGAVLITSDPAGAIISRRPDPEKWLGKKISPEMLNVMSQPQQRPLVLTGADDIPRLHAFARIGNADLTNFTVTIGIPTDDIVAAAQHDQTMALAALAATTILALFATWFAGNIMIVRRMKTLVSTAEKITSGDLQARTGMQYSREEIGYLAHAFDDMAESLQRQEAERDKTEALLSAEKAEAKRAAEELRTADRRKDEFLAMLGHELRNPLAPIRNAAEILKLIRTDEPRVHQTSDIIARQVDHMTNLVDDLLDVSRVTRGLVTLDEEAFDFRHIVADAVEQVRSLIDARRHHLAVSMTPEPACVRGDRARLMQILTNLLNNAAKYTPEDGQIVLRVEADNDVVTVNVKDNGVGIGPELLPHVFELFSQAERSPDRSQGGLGLGLALVKRLAELHGGSVTAHSEGIGKGSEFMLRLPRLPATEHRPQQRASDRAPPAPTAALHMMVVDDNADAAKTIAMLLEILGYSVAVEYDAHSALKRARIEAPRVLLLDIGLPDMDGYELARRLRAMPETAQATLIALTGYGQEEDRARTKAAGFDHHFVKPVDPAQLAALLADISHEMQA
jgi:signal transduction histidine kinase/ActR/RegA family two-component response regulator